MAAQAPLQQHEMPCGSFLSFSAISAPSGCTSSGVHGHRRPLRSGQLLNAGEAVLVRAWPSLAGVESLKLSLVWEEGLPPGTSGRSVPLVCFGSGTREMKQEEAEIGRITSPPAQRWKQPWHPAPAPPELQCHIWGCRFHSHQVPSSVRRCALLVQFVVTGATCQESGGPGFQVPPD